MINYNFIYTNHLLEKSTSLNDGVIYRLHKLTGQLFV